MDNSFIKKKAISGTKWTLISFGATFAASYLTNIILGRVSPMALGTYVTVIIFISILSTFILFGGCNVLSNFLPKAASAGQMANLVLTYAALVITLMLLAVCFFVFLPSILEFFMRREVKGVLFWFFIGFTPIFVIFQVIQFALNGLMEIKTRALLERLQTLGVCLPIFVTFLFWRDFLVGNYFVVILASTFGVNLIGLLLGAKILLSKLDFVSLQKKPFLPNGFWPFTVSTHAATIFSFAHSNIDRLFILQLGSLGGLGLYQATLTISSLTHRLPQLLQGVMIPSFSSLISKEDKEAVKRAYMKIQRYSIFLATSLSVLIICFSRSLLSLFGSEYIRYYYLLIILCTVSSIASLSYANWPLLFSTEKNAARLANSAIQIMFQVLMTVLLIRNLGVLGVVLAMGGSRLVAQIIPTYMVIKKLPFGIRIPRCYYIGVLVVLTLGVAYRFLASRTLLLSFCILGWIAFIRLGSYKSEDIRYLYKLFLMPTAN